MAPSLSLLRIVSASTNQALPTTRTSHALADWVQTPPTLGVSLTVAQMLAWQCVYGAWRSHVFTATKCCPPANFDRQIGCQSTHLNLLFKMVPSVLDENPGHQHIFLYKNKTLQVDLSQIESYFEVIIPNSHLR